MNFRKCFSKHGQILKSLNNHKNEDKDSYDFKLPKLLKTNEHELINAIKINCWPKCKSINIIKRGLQFTALV